MKSLNDISILVTYDLSIHALKILNFAINPEKGTLIRFNVAGETGTTVFCSVTIPKDLLWAEDTWIVLVGGTPVNPTIIEEANSIYFFTYNHSTTIIGIKETDAIQDFPTWTLLLLTLTVLAAVLSICKRKLQKR